MPGFAFACLLEGRKEGRKERALRARGRDKVGRLKDKDALTPPCSEIKTAPKSNVRKKWTALGDAEFHGGHDEKRFSPIRSSGQELQKIPFHCSHARAEAAKEGSDNIGGGQKEGEEGGRAAN